MKRGTQLSEDEVLQTIEQGPSIICEAYTCS